MEEFIVEYGLWVAYILLAITALLAIVLPLVNMVGNPKALLMTLGGVVLLGLIYLLAYAISSGEVTPEYMNLGINTPTASKLVGGALIMTYGMVIITLITIAVTELKNIFK